MGVSTGPNFIRPLNLLFQQENLFHQSIFCKRGYNQKGLPLIEHNDRRMASVLRDILKAILTLQPEMT